MLSQVLDPIVLPASMSKPQAIHLPLAYLRAFVIVLVVAHHSVLAYFPGGPLPVSSLLTDPRWWMAFPVVDPAKWIGFLPFVVVNDTFLMPLLFFMSGLFVWASLQRKGPAVYLQSRVFRLGVPFGIFCVISPFAYYPAYLQGHLSDGYRHEWFHLGTWPSGPAWFLWALLASDLICVVILFFMAKSFVTLGNWLRDLPPVHLAAMLTLISGAAYLPALVRFGPFDVFVYGPLLISKSRCLFYFSYFLLGVALGSGGTPEKLLSARGKLAHAWPAWVVAAVASFALRLGCIYFSHRYWNPPLWTMLSGAGFVVSCSLSCFAALAVSLRFITRPKPILDNLLACALGIYIVHYLFIPWLQLGMLPVALPAVLKGLLVFVVSLALSWSLVALARRSSSIARIL